MTVMSVCHWPCSPFHKIMRAVLVGMMLKMKVASRPHSMTGVTLFRIQITESWLWSHEGSSELLGNYMIDDGIQ